MKSELQVKRRISDLVRKLETAKFTHEEWIICIKKLEMLRWVLEEKR